MARRCRLIHRLLDTATEDVSWVARYGRLEIRVVYLAPRVADLWRLRLTGFHSSLLPSPIRCHLPLLVVTVCHIAPRERGQLATVS
ncbi:hypothetical protein CH063_00908 [Colletotrichum higginsianum]|uniref:Uncharacterized protein n=1 Tax=Colletotrichum higginsianum (strain IMI 349063) TaxID=759273 RepID=H1UYK3_COLHI|nr:hypothetical protein CH063_00908 [Colletotrichum higginsianum]